MYFLRLMADGRKLERRLRPARPASGPEEADSQIPLITVDQALWTVHPFDEGGEAAADDEADTALAAVERSDTTQLLS